MSGSEDTIFALSSGSPPAAVAVVRISGTDALAALKALGGPLPLERRVSLRTLRDAEGAPLDRALVHWAPGPATATGEDIAELHLHGGRAVIDAVLGALGRLPGLRMALPGEFTRRAFVSGRIDLAEAEGLADLLAAETEHQRRAALGHVGGAFRRLVEEWRQQLVALAAEIEAQIEYGEEEQLGLAAIPHRRIESLAAAMQRTLDAPPAERIRDGVRVVIAGPPNAGKSTLLNALAGRDAAIVSPLPGTTRDVIEAPTALAGIPFLLADTAGLRVTDDIVEAEGVSRAERLLADADILLWVGEPLAAPDHSACIRLQTKFDLGGGDGGADLAISAVRGDGMEQLRHRLIAHAQRLMPRESEVALNQRQRSAIGMVVGALRTAGHEEDELIAAEHLRAAMAALDAASGRTTTEDMLDALFSGFCVGK